MFQDIYPRQFQTGPRSLVALLEELGELAEAVRVFEVHPKYFLGEAADAFSYLMGIATEHQLREAQDGREFSFETEFLRRYPGLCKQCGFQVCACPAVPSATIGRMAKELSIAQDERPFVEDMTVFAAKGAEAAWAVLERFGGYSAVARQLPFDRGDANHALVYLCLRIADAVEISNGALAGTLRSEAVRIGASPSPAGSPSASLDVSNVLDELRAEWRKIGEETQRDIRAAGGLVGGLGEAWDSIQILFVAPNPTAGGSPLRINAELRAIKESIKSGESGSKIFFEDLPAATVNDFRTALLHGAFDVVHFSGHADADTLVFEEANGDARDVSMAAFAQAVAPHGIKCVVLNACESVQGMTVPISPITIGMDETIDDDAAIAFSRGFYDALAQGHGFERAFEEGKIAVSLDGHDDKLIRLISST